MRRPRICAVAPGANVLVSVGQYETRLCCQGISQDFGDPVICAGASQAESLNCLGEPLAEVLECEGTDPQDVRRWFPTSGVSIDAEVRLICLPALASGIAPYSLWRRHLPDWLEVLPVRLPGVESRVDERPMADLYLLVEQIHATMKNLQPLPTVLFGHCFGALLAYELARELVAHQSAPAALWVFAQYAPSHIAMQTFDVGDVWERFSEYANIPNAIQGHDSMRRLLSPVLKAQFAILDSYVAPSIDSKIPLPILASRGVDDRIVKPADLARWDSVTSSELILLEFPGGHDLVREPAELLDEIARRLEPLRGSPR